MSKKVKRDKHKSRKGRGRGASNGSAGEPIISEVVSEGEPAEQPAGKPEPEDTPHEPKTPRAPKAPRPPQAPVRLNGLDKAQKDKHNALISSRNDTAQLRSKAGAPERRVQGRRSGNR